MSISLRKLTKGLIFALTTLLFVVFILFDTYTWGKYAFLGISICIFILGCILTKGRLFLKITPFVWLNVLFIAFVLLSSLWAINATDSLVMARTLFRTMICAYMVYITCLNDSDFDATLMLKAVMWAGYIVALYTIAFYGIDAIIAACGSESLRVENDFANVNSIAMMCALSCVIQIHLTCLRPKDRFFPTVLFAIPTILVIAATQSRKAFVFFAVGAVGYSFVKMQNGKKGLFIKLLKLFVSLCIAAVVIYLILQMDAFAGIRERMEGLINSFLGRGEVDSSTIKRNQLRELGLAYFLKNPFGGIGIANPHILAEQLYAFDAYLHDNYIELLCGGGIVGFCLYYAMHVYLLFNLWKYRRVDPQRAAFFALWIFLMLAMDYGAVSYYSKTQNFYLMIHFLNVYQLKNKATSAKGIVS